MIELTRPLPAAFNTGDPLLTPHMLGSISASLPSNIRVIDALSDALLAGVWVMTARKTNEHNKKDVKLMKGGCPYLYKATSICSALRFRTRFNIPNRRIGADPPRAKTK